MPPASRAALVETPAAPFSEIMDEQGAWVAHQLPGSVLSVSVDPTERVLGSSVTALQYNISNLNASLPGLMELLRLM